MARKIDGVMAALPPKRRANLKQRARELSAFFSPEWHGLALKEAERAVAEGRASFVTLDTAKKELRNRT